MRAVFKTSLFFAFVLLAIVQDGNHQLAHGQDTDRKLTIRTYREGDEILETKIGPLIEKDWVWPHLHSLEELQQEISRPSFDPRSRLYAFRGGELVAFTDFWFNRPRRLTPKKARIHYPRFLPGNEDAAEPLVRRAMEILSQEFGQTFVEMHVGTMLPGSLEMARRCGFSESADRPFGYKKYYTYDLSRRDLPISTDIVSDFDPSRDLAESARLAWMWYKRPVAWCRDHLLRDAEYYESFAHLVVRDGEELVAGCFIAPNYSIRKETTAALYYQYALTPEDLRPLIVEAVKRSRKAGFEILLVDLIYDHLHFEPTYRTLGFEKAAEWAVYEWRPDGR